MLASIWVGSFSIRNGKLGGIIDNSLITPRWAHAIALAAVLCVGLGTSARAQISSQQTLSGGTSDWFNAAAWDNGVPNNPGDSAQLLFSGATATLQLSNGVTLEQLLIEGYDSLNLVGGGPLSFRTDGVGQLFLSVSAPSSTLTTTISVPVSLSETDALHVNVAASGTLQWNGAITSAAGDLIKQGAGVLRFAGNNSGWGGELVVEGGTVVVTTNAALGTLDHGVSIRSGATLALEQSTAEAIAFNEGTLSVPNITVSGAITLEGSGVIHRPRNPLTTDPRGGTFERTLGPTTISSSTSGSGDLYLRNESRDPVNLTGTNSHTGHTYIEAGQIFAKHATSLGTGDGGTTVRGGSLILQAPTDDQFRVEGGLLDFAAGDFMTPHSITVAGGEVALASRPDIATPIVLEGSGGAIRGKSFSSFSGGSTGAGNLLVRNLKIDAPLTHNGDLVTNGVHLNVANSYTGNSRVTGDTTLNHAKGFGSATSPIRVDVGTLTLNVLPFANRAISVEGASLVVNTADPMHSPIALDGTLEGITFFGPIDLIPSNGTTQIIKGTFNGPIRGTTPVSLGSMTGTVVLNGANDLQGHTRITNGTVVANHPQSLNHASTHVETGTLELNSAVSHPILMTSRTFGNETGKLRLNQAQDIDMPWMLNAGRIEPTVEIGMSQLILWGSNGVARVESSGAGSLRIDDELLVAGGGELAGKVKGDGNIRLTGNTLNIGGDFAEFTGEIHVQNGELNVGYGSGFTVPHTLNAGVDLHVYDGGVLHWTSGTSGDDVIIENDIYLHNANGPYGFRGSLARSGNGSHVLAGRVDVGDEGSTIADQFRVTGVLTGRNLTVDGSGLDLYSNQEQLRGTLRLSNEAGLGLTWEGQLHGLDEVVIENGSYVSFGPSAADHNRLDDATRVVSEGGNIFIYSDRNGTTRETLGNLHLKQGSTSTIVNSNVSVALLAMQNVTRDPGTILRFAQAGNTSFTRIFGDVSLNCGIIGPWAVTSTGFATLSELGTVSTKSATAFADINAAGPQDHVIVSGNQTLSANKSVASLQHNEDGTLRSLNLNGHELTVLSGGVFRSQEITNGRLTAGEGADAELIFHHGHRVSADIVDNAGGGSVALVVSSAGLRVSGNNSYTGGTWVVGTEYHGSKNATLTIENLSAIPANDRVYVDKGVYQMHPLTGGEVHLAELHVRNGGSVSGSFLAPLDVDEMFLEDGGVNALLKGDGSIIKRTGGSVDFSNSQGQQFTGTVTVQNGLLSLQHSTLPQATFIVEGGQLNLSGDFSSAANNIILNGGTLGSGNFAGHVDVQGDSQIFHNGFTTFRGTITGSGDLTIRGLETVHDRYVGFFGNASGYSGDIRIESGSLRVGAPSNAGTGVITVDEAGQLILGSNHYDDPPTVLANEVHLRGGRLYATSPWNGSLPGKAPPSVLSGDVFVHNEAFIGALRLGVQNGGYVPALTFVGQLNLLDGAHVYGLSDTWSQVLSAASATLVEVSRELRVGAETSWHLLSSTLTISGTIRPLETHGSIDFEGIPSSLRLDGAEFQVDAGQSLAVTVNGGAIPVQLDAPGSTLGGNGTLVGDFTVTGGSAIAPGESPGTLTIDGSAMIGPGGLLSIEIAGTKPGVDFDRLDVLDDVVLDGALLDVSFLDGFVPSPNDGFVILRASSIDGVFANAASSIVVGGVTLPVAYRSQMVILGNATAVPEPSVELLLGIAIAFICAYCRREAVIFSTVSKRNNA